MQGLAAGLLALQLTAQHCSRAVEAAAAFPLRIAAQAVTLAPGGRMRKASTEATSSGARVKASARFESKKLQTYVCRGRLLGHLRLE